jgi:hypothetical protein
VSDRRVGVILFIGLSIIPTRRSYPLRRLDIIIGETGTQTGLPTCLHKDRKEKENLKSLLSHEPLFRE